MIVLFVVCSSLASLSGPSLSICDCSTVADIIVVSRRFVGTLSKCQKACGAHTWARCPLTSVPEWINIHTCAWIPLSLSLLLCPSRSLSGCAIAYRNKKLINMRDALTSFAFQAEDRSFFCCSVFVFFIVIVPRWNGFGPRAQFAALTNLKNRRANHHLTLTLCRKIMRHIVKLTISTCKWTVHFQPHPAF